MGERERERLMHVQSHILYNSHFPKGNDAVAKPNAIFCAVRM